MPYTSQSGPTRFQAVILDLDGTLTPSYTWLLTISDICDIIERRHGKQLATLFATDYLGGKRQVNGNLLNFQEVLHAPAATRSALKQLAADYHLPNFEEDAEIQILLERGKRMSFQLYAAAEELLKAAKNQGAFTGIYTNSWSHLAIRRQDKSGILAHLLDAVWARQSDRDVSLINDNRADMAGKLIPYNYKKPDDTPLKELHTLGISPEQILYIGEGKSDLATVYRNSRQPGAVFAFQEQGAREICARQISMNELIRPGSEPLGIHAVEAHMQRLGISEQAIIRMQDGFHTLLDLMKAGALQFTAPQIKPCVRKNKIGSTHLLVNDLPTFQHVPYLQLSLTDPRVTDKILVQQILTLSRLWHFVLDEKAVRLEPERMKNNYGLLLFDDKLGPMMDACRERAASGSALCTKLCDAIDKLKTAMKTSDSDTVMLENYVHELKKDPSILALDGRIDVTSGLEYWLSESQPQLLPQTTTAANSKRFAAAL